MSLFQNSSNLFSLTLYEPGRMHFLLEGTFRISLDPHHLNGLFLVSDAVECHATVYRSSVSCEWFSHLSWNDLLFQYFSRITLTTNTVHSILRPDASEGRGPTGGHGRSGLRKPVPKGFGRHSKSAGASVSRDDCLLPAEPRPPSASSSCSSVSSSSCCRCRCRCRQRCSCRRLSPHVSWSPEQQPLFHALSPASGRSRFSCPCYTPRPTTTFALAGSRPATAGLHTPRASVATQTRTVSSPPKPPPRPSRPTAQTADTSSGKWWTSEWQLKEPAAASARSLSHNSVAMHCQPGPPFRPPPLPPRPGRLAAQGRRVEGVKPDDAPRLGLAWPALWGGDQEVPPHLQTAPAPSFLSRKFHPSTSFGSRWQLNRNQSLEGLATTNNG
ncbi:unnamed protein product [Protopolystoma xenopodis]|uniref:Uncharacterized protein n=1 Tax=Protopolystoma xenopodis TaxID=117903 RepID=A0A3S4ZUJ1_9PLAT|nr:unnamed protein product [Protopolystoma xenopodis]